MKKKNKTYRRYHLPLLNGYIGIGCLGFSLLILFFSFILSAASLPNILQNGCIRFIFKIFVIINIFSVFLSFMKRICYKFQVFTHILIGINFLIFVLDFYAIGLIMITKGNRNLFLGWLYIIVMPIIMIISSAYYVYCYKIKKGYVLGCGIRPNKNNRKDNYNMQNLWLIIYGVILISPYLLKGIFMSLTGFAVGGVFSVVMTSTMIDPFYAAYLIYKHPEYREERL